MKKNFRNLIEEIKSLKAQLSEDYIFNGDEGMMGDGMESQEMPMERPHQEMGDGDSEEEIAMHAQEVIQHEPIIGKIRETAIEGLKKYSDHPTSKIYEFMKKVFLEADKVLTDTGKD
jgi:hypothetical protein